MNYLIKNILNKVKTTLLVPSISKFNILKFLRSLMHYEFINLLQIYIIKINIYNFHKLLFTFIKYNHDI